MSPCCSHQVLAVAGFTYKFQKGGVFMSRIAAICLVLFLALTTTATVSANNHCHFGGGFATLRDMIGHDVVGDCWENEHYNANGDSTQRTSGGMLVWRKADNWTAFTDGYRTWVNGPNGLEIRGNTERFAWEQDPPPASAPPPPPAPTPTPIPAPESTIDPRLVPALEMIIDRDVDLLNDIVSFALWKGTSFVIAPIPDRAGQEIGGTYISSANNITISDTFFARSTVPVVAAMLVHELTHVLPDLEEWNALTAENRCLRQEFTAEYMVGLFWHMMYGYGGSRLDDPVWNPHLNHLADLVRDQGLHGDLYRLAGYIRERFGAICAARAA